MAGAERKGKVGCGWLRNVVERQEWKGAFRLGVERVGSVWQEWRGVSKRGVIWIGAVWQERKGLLSLGS